MVLKNILHTMKVNNIFKRCTVLLISFFLSVNVWPMKGARSSVEKGKYTHQDRIHLCRKVAAVNLVKHIDDFQEYQWLIENFEWKSAYKNIGVTVLLAYGCFVAMAKLCSKEYMTPSLKPELKKISQFYQISLDELIEPEFRLILSFYEKLLDLYSLSLKTNFKLATSTPDVECKIFSPLYFCFMVQGITEWCDILDSPRYALSFNKELRLNIALTMGLLLKAVFHAYTSTFNLKVILKKEVIVETSEVMISEKFIDMYFENCSDLLEAGNREAASVLLLASTVYIYYWFDMLEKTTYESPLDDDAINTLTLGLLISMRAQFYSNDADKLAVNFFHLLHRSVILEDKLHLSLKCSSELQELYFDCMSRYVKSVIDLVEHMPYNHKIIWSYLHDMYQLRDTIISLKDCSDCSADPAVVSVEEITQGAISRFEELRASAAQKSDDHFKTICREEKQQRLVREKLLREKQILLEKYQQHRKKRKAACLYESDTTQIMKPQKEVISGPWEQKMHEAGIHVTQECFCEAIEFIQEALALAKNADEKIISNFESVFIFAAAIQNKTSYMIENKNFTMKFEGKVKELYSKRDTVAGILEKGCWSAPQEALELLTLQGVKYFTKEDRLKYVETSGQLLESLESDTENLALLHRYFQSVFTHVRQLELLISESGECSAALGSEGFDLFTSTAFVQQALGATVNNYRWICQRLPTVSMTLLHVKELNRHVGVYGHGDKTRISEETLLQRRCEETLRALHSTEACDVLKKMVKTLAEREHSPKNQLPEKPSKISIIRQCRLMPTRAEGASCSIATQ